MEGLNYKDKIAILKLLSEIVYADNIVQDSEVTYMKEVVKSFGLNENYKSDVDDLMTLDALSIIRELSIEQKREVSKMMGKMIVVDGDINYNEVKLYNYFCQSCNIENDFNIEDYPNYTLSGPFINPEDL